jgi:hypothetical protein
MPPRHTSDERVALRHPIDEVAFISHAVAQSGVADFAVMDGGWATTRGSGPLNPRVTCSRVPAWR